MYNALIVAVPAFFLFAAIGLSQLEPRLPTFTPDELRETAGYHNRMNRTGTFTHPKFASALSFKVCEKRILYLPGRTT